MPAKRRELLSDDPVREVVLRHARGLIEREYAAGIERPEWAAPVEDCAPILAEEAMERATELTEAIESGEVYLAYLRHERDALLARIVEEGTRGTQQRIQDAGLRNAGHLSRARYAPSDGWEAERRFRERWRQVAKDVDREGTWVSELEWAASLPDDWNFEDALNEALRDLSG